MAASTISNSTVGVAGPAHVTVGGDFTVYGSTQESFTELAVPPVSPAFQGRQDVIQTLDTLYFSDEPRKRKVVVCGAAGYGKTEFAKKYANHLETSKKIKRTFWVVAETTDNLDNNFESLKKAYKTFKDGQCLFVFDNGESRRGLSKYLPPDTHNNALVLITSQLHDWGDAIVTVRIKPVSVHTSFKIFKEILGPRYEHVTENEIKEIIEFIEGIPLGLVVVAGHLRRAMDALGSYFDIVEFKKGILGPSVLDKDIHHAVGSPYTHTIRAAIHFTLNNMSKLLSSEENNITHQVLCVCAHLDPDSIQRKDVEEILHVCGVRDNGLIRLCVNTAKGFSFIQPETGCDDYYSIHRLCQQILRTYYENEEKKNMKAACYRACVEVALENKDWHWRGTSSEAAILAQADNNRTVVNKMLREYYLSNDNIVLQPSHPNYLKLKTLLQTLVKYACYECLFTFLNDINKSGRERIMSEMELMHMVAAVRDGGAGDAVRRLVEMGGDVHDRNHFLGDTALHVATRLGNEAVVSALLDAGCNVNAINNVKWTALHVAACEGKEAVVRMLLNAGTNALATDKNEQTALHVAARLDQQAVVRMLLKAGSNSLATDNSGRTALHLAAHWGQEAVVRMLVNAGSNALATDNDGRTALHLAACRSNEAVVRALLDAGCNVNAIDKYGWTALHWAALGCKVGVVRMLLDAGANVNARDCKGRTALDIAPTQSHTRVQHILRETSLNNEHQK